MFQRVFTSVPAGPVLATRLLDNTIGDMLQICSLHCVSVAQCDIFIMRNMSCTLYA